MAQRKPFQVKTLPTRKNRGPSIVASKQQQRLDRLILDWIPCEKCKIAEYAANKVFIRSDKHLHKIRYLLCGEAPGKTEDLRGSPFIGSAGKVLDALLKAAMLKRYSIINLVACRPTDRLGGGNRKPTEAEIDACRPRVEETYDIIRPEALILLGEYAADYWPGEIDRETTLYLYHPSYIDRRGGVGSPEFNKTVKLLKAFKAKIEGG